MKTDSRVQRVIQWETHDTPGPWSITLFPTNKCNLYCEHCWLRWGGYDRTYKSEMSDERLLRLVDEAAALGVKEWTIVGGGDPMVRGDVVLEMCEKIRQHNMDGLLHTNGTLFKPKHLQSLVDMQWGRVAISLDGPTSESNNAVRGAGFEKATRNMSKLNELKSSLGAALPAMSIHSVITNKNYDKIDELLDLASEHGCDTVNLTLLLVESDGCKPFAITDAEKETLKNNVEKAIEKADKMNIQNNFSLFLRDEIITNSTQMKPDDVIRVEKGIAKSMCFEPYSSMTIHPNGLAGPCCVYWDEEANSVKDSSLEDVWMGPYFRSLREDFMNNRPKRYCELCPSSLYGRIEATRSEIKLAQQPSYQRIGDLLGKGIQGLQQDGLQKTLQRGSSWVKRHL